MGLGRRGLMATAAVGMGLLASGTAVLMPAVRAASLTPIFDRPVAVDAQRLAGEPDLTVGPDGRMYASAPWGVQTDTIFFWRSEDGGTDWRQVQALPGLQNPTLVQGSGDSELQAGSFVPKSGVARVFFVNQEQLLTNQCGYSDDAERTFVQTQACPNLMGADRQWVAVTPVDPTVAANGGKLDHDVTYLWFDTVSSGNHLFRADDGLNYSTEASIVDKTGSTSTGNPGNAIADHNTGVAYVTVPDSASNGEGVAVGYTVDGGKTLTMIQAVPFKKGGSTATDFSVLAIDSAGGLYLVYTQQQAVGEPWQTFMTHTTGTTLVSSGAPANRMVPVAGATSAQWSTPVPVTGPGSLERHMNYSVFPWITAGDPGRVDVAYYGTTAGLSYDPNSQSAQWNTYIAQSLDANTDRPDFVTVPVSERPTHLASICFNGVGCTATGNRNMLDFFEVQHDTRGAAVVIYNDDANTMTAKFPGGPYDVVARQVGGPSLCTAVGDIGGSAPVDVSYQTDPPGDGLLPTSDTNIKSLDLLGVGATLKDASTIEVSFKVADLSSPFAQLPVSEVASGATGVTYLLTWKWNDDVWFAAAKVDAAGDWQYIAGRPQSIPFTLTGGPKLAAYVLGPNSGTVSGTADATQGVVAIDVPTSAVGGIKSGDRMIQATGYSLADRVVQVAPGLPTVPLGDQADMTEAFDEVLGASTTAQPAPAAPATPAQPGALPNSSTAPPLLLTVILIGAVALFGARAKASQ